MKTAQLTVISFLSIFALGGCAYFDWDRPGTAQNVRVSELEAIEVERLEVQAQEQFVERRLVFDEGRVQVFLLDEPLPEPQEKDAWRLPRLEVYPFEDGPSGSSFWSDKFDFLLPWKS